MSENLLHKVNWWFKSSTIANIFFLNLPIAFLMDWKNLYGSTDA